MCRLTEQKKAEIKLLSDGELLDYAHDHARIPKDHHQPDHLEVEEFLSKVINRREFN